MVALVWIRVICSPSSSMVRLVEEMMPSVTVPLSSPRELPMATAFSPVVSLLESPKTAGVRPDASILSRAMSVWESVPTTVAL